MEESCMTLLPKFKYRAKYGRQYSHHVCEDCKRKYILDNMLQNHTTLEWRCIRCHNARRKTYDQG